MDLRSAIRAVARLPFAFPGRLDAEARRGSGRSAGQTFSTIPGIEQILR